MGKYDPNWLAKLKHKQISKDLKRLTHVRKDARSNSALCGTSIVNGHASTIPFPSKDSLPTCATCRELFLKSLEPSE